MRRRVPALGLVFALLCALALVVPAPASATTTTAHVGHFGKKVVVASFDQHGPSPRLDQPVATAPHTTESHGDGVLAGDAATPTQPLASFAPTLHTRGPPAGH